MHALKILIVLFSAILISPALQAQRTVTGKLVDSASSKPIPMATVSIYRATDTLLLGYRLTGQDGKFSMPGLKENVPMRIVITSVGYATGRREILSDSANADLGSISLSPSTSQLEEVTVIAERPPVVIRKDTVEFNANAFKTLPNAVVEDLLKKLPGVQVDADGNITVNGKRVNRILVDGKSFFGSDPKMATRNLPSNVIDKVQVVDDEEELNASETDNKNNIGKVINLTFKKGMKKGVFGKAYAGAGTKGTYETGLIANLFKDTLQMSVLGYSNNLNRPGFTGSELRSTGGLSRTSDVTGNSNNSNNNSLLGSSVTVNSINFGGLSNLGGITTSNGAGLNVNHSPSKKKTFFAQYFYGDMITRVTNSANTLVTNKDTLVTYNSSGKIKVNSGSHLANAGIKLKPDSVLTVLATVSFTKGLQDNHTGLLQNVFQNYAGDLSRGDILTNKINDDITIKPFLSVTRLSKTKKGRRMSFSSTYLYNKKANDFFTDASMQYIQPLVFDSIIDQLRNEQITQNFYSAYLNYSEPLIKNVTLRMNARFENDALKNNTSTDGKSNTGYNIHYADLSSTLNRTSRRVGLYAGLELRFKDVYITPGLRLQSQKFETALSQYKDPLTQKLNNILPQLAITWKEFQFNYDRDLQLPSYRYIIPVQDNSNPYVIYNGNIGLRPAMKDDYWVNYYKYFTKSNVNVWGWVNYSTAKYEVINNIKMNPGGVQAYYPLNSNGSRYFATNAGIGKDYKQNPKFIYGWNVGWYIQHNNNNFIYNDIASRQKTWNLNTWGLVKLNWNDKFEWNQTFSWGGQTLRNSNPVFAGYKVRRYGFGTEFIGRPGKKVVMETQLDYFYNSAIMPANMRSFLMWRAAVNFLFLKDDRGVLRISGYDLLDKVRNTSVYLNQNTIRTTQTSVLPQYFLATFTYNIRKMGAKKRVGGQWELW